jgi:multidrug efflux pump subunit AcrB
VISQYEEDGKSVNIRLKGKSEGQYDDVRRQIENIVLSGMDNNPVRAGSVFSVENIIVPETLARQDKKDVVYIDIAPQASARAQTASAAQEVVRNNRNVVLKDSSVLSIYRKSIILTGILVIALIYITLGIQFESFLLPLVFMLSLAFTLAGTGPAALVTGINIDLGMILGFVVLFGVAVNNGVVLYEIALERLGKQKDADFAEAIVKGAVERLPSILLTTITTLSVLVPMTLLSEVSSQVSLSITMAGGIVASVMLTLFVMPVIFKLFITSAAKRGRNMQ